MAGRFHVAAGRRRNTAGFTLMELMAVVGIIVVMAALVVGGYSGIQRAMGSSSGADNFRRALVLARQQACVDGTDMFVWCIDPEKYIVCRRGGIVSGLATGRSSKRPGTYSRDEFNAWWVCDEYADLGDGAEKAYFMQDGTLSGGATGESDAYDEDIAKDFLKAFKQNWVFDITKKKACVYAYPPFYNAEDDCWMFGIDMSDYISGTFLNGHEYAWALMPVQNLPGGYVFEGSYRENDGEVDESWMQKAYVHFFPDGRAETGMSSGFTITETGVKNPYAQTVTVSGDGLVSVTRSRN